MYMNPLCGAMTWIQGNLLYGPPSDEFLFGYEVKQTTLVGLIDGIE